jgi:hypothetical protein
MGIKHSVAGGGIVNSTEMWIAGKRCEYMICVSNLPGFQTPKEYRDFAEKISDTFGYKIIRFGAWFRTKQSFGDSKGYSYSEAKKIFFDAIPISEFGGIDFSGTNEKKGHISNFELGFLIDCEQKLLYSTLVFKSDISTIGILIDYANQFRRMLEDVSKVDFFVADRMDAGKWPESFVHGTGFGERNDYENKVAFNISDTRLKHHKLPYLFTYNYMKTDSGFLSDIPKYAEYVGQDGYVTLTIPECFGKDLDQYPSLSEWQSIYRVLKSRGELVVTNQLAEMIEQIISLTCTA